MTQKHPRITKSNGDVVPFEAAKLRASLMRAGASKRLAQRITEEVETTLYPEISTGEIYQHAYDLLRADSHRNAGRYKLKQALVELGASGFPFEQFVGALMQAQGYSVEFNRILPGKCVRHELDVVATKGAEMRLVECKYHAQRGQKTDVKVSLYIHARMQDLGYSPEMQHSLHDRQLQPWLVTNTRFSDDSMAYGRCVGMHLVAWDYPALSSLKEMVETTGLYPITCLGSLTSEEKVLLAERKVILCRQLEDSGDVLRKIGMSPERIETVVEEAGKILADFEAGLEDEERRPSPR
jgi:hypothetical protein